VNARFRGAGFSILELLVVIVVIGIIAAISTPLYVGWRADSANQEAARVVNQRITTARAEAKRAGATVTVRLSNGSNTLLVNAAEVPLPHAATFDLLGEPTLDLVFEAVTGTQATFAVVEFDVTTGTGAFERTARLSVVPPLGKVGVVR